MLIAVFVLLFGLLGVLALIPVAMLRMNQALQADRGTAVAQAAMEEIKVRGLLAPNSWLRWDSSSSSWQPVVLPASGAFALDPLYIARNTTNATDLGVFNTTGGGTFPYGGASWAMPRVSFVGTSASVPIALPVAERWFVSHDDLMVDTPTDPNQRPSLMFNDAAGAFGVTIGSAAVRQIEGNYSWLATVSADPNKPDRYNMAVAVFRNRDTTLPTASRARDPAKLGERVVDVAILGNGVGGGGVRISVPSSVASPTAAWLDALPGQWMLLGTPTGTVFQWYRIVSLGDPIPPGTAWSRELTLAGPDWSWGTPAVGVLFTDVITVHTANVRAN